MPATTTAMKKLCPYCRDDREAFPREGGGWWHFVARGGDLGDTEPCQASKLRGEGGAA